ncbi:MAG: Fpg/Nei family DNA glycosylase [Thermodesulfobacteriota bacterium]
MPELPDVEIFRQYMESTSLQQEIRNVEVPGKDMLEGTSASRLKKVLRGRLFQNARRHGKYLFGGLDEEGWLVLHFGMTGFLSYFRDEKQSTSHKRLLIRFSNGYTLAYHCLRKLGKIALADDLNRFIEEKGLGPDPLGSSFDLETFSNTMSASRAAVKSTLMNQKLLAGIGNIYSDEILFQAGIRPGVKTRDLSDKDLESIYIEITQNVLPTAIEARADPSRLPASFIIPHRHGGGACPLCGTALRKTRIGGRTAYFCPQHQHGC